MISVLMTLLVLTWLNAFLAVSFHKDFYTQSREDRNTAEWERDHEKLRIASLSIESNQKPNATVVNEGAVPIVLADLWVTDLTNNTNRVYNLSQTRELIIPTGSYEINVGQNVNATPTLALNNLHSYDIRVYTKRGNFAKQTYVPTTPNTDVGPFYFSFDKQSFNYTTSNAGGGPAWEIVCSSSYPKNNIIFILKFTNHGDRAIEISYLSYMMVVAPLDDYLEDEYYYHILNNTSTSVAPVAYTDYSQVVPANPQNKVVGVTQTVKFGGLKPGSSTLQSFPIPPAASQYASERKFVYTVWIGIFWRWQGTSDYYGIYVPFTGIHVRSS